MTTESTMNFELESTVARIREHGYRRIALQFPDSLLKYAPGVAAQLQDLHRHQETPPQFFVLADTSYGSCCVDEVAAEHANADFLVHYGPACLSPTTRLPVYYVFVEEPMGDMEPCLSAFRTHFPDPNQHVLLFADVNYQHGLEPLREQLAVDYAHVKIATIKETFVPPRSSTTTTTTETWTFAGRTLPCSRQDLLAQEYSIFYLGREGPTLTNLLLNWNACPVVSFDPSVGTARLESISVNRQLAKRFLLVEKAKDAEVIGILAGTLGVANYTDIINELRTLITQSGRRPFIITVGKLNPAKLANFMEMDVFVLVACPQNSIVLDSKDFMKPILTPHELRMALTRGLEWDSRRYCTDFRSVLEGIKEDGDGGVGYEAEDGQEDTPEFSLATGKMTRKAYGGGARNGPRADATNDSSTSNALTKVDVGELVSASSQLLIADRSWKGLELQYEEEPEASVLTEGRRGIARGYTHEIGYEQRGR